MVLIELEYLYEIGRLRWPSRELYLKIERETSLKTCALPFSTVARTAIDEKWTRDTFDRIIVAQAKTNGLAFLISADEDVAKHYQRTVW
jgi:PIN domain nuclease of toxin-antitoxin system